MSATSTPIGCQNGNPTIPSWSTDSLGDIIVFYPSPSSIASKMKTEIDVLSHLLCHPYERDALRDETCRRSPYQPHTFQIYHLFLEQKLNLNSHHSDFEFTTTIQKKIREQEAKSYNGLYRFYQTLSHHLPFLIRNPFGIRIDINQLIVTLHLQWGPLVEVIILPKEIRIAPLQY
jgi:hypothetical protein